MTWANVYTRFLGIELCEYNYSRQNSELDCDGIQMELLKRKDSELDIQTTCYNSRSYSQNESKEW